MNTLVILGASGHGKVIADIGLKNEYENILFLDDNATGKCLGFPIVGTSEDLERLNDGKTDFVIAVGNNAIRRRIAESHDVNWVKLIHRHRLHWEFRLVKEPSLWLARSLMPK